jgi:hypothetical protein
LVYTLTVITKDPGKHQLGPHGGMPFELATAQWMQAELQRFGIESELVVAPSD